MDQGRTIFRAWLAAAAALFITLPAHAVKFELPGWSEESVEGVLNATITAGAAWRVEGRAADLVGKSDLNPALCGRENGKLRWQGCQGLFRLQTFTADRLVNAPGQFSMNADDGNLNYDRGDIVQAPFKLTMDVTLTHGNWGLFAKGLYFYDFVNQRFTEHHPNQINSSNYEQVGNISTGGTELVTLGELPAPLPVPVGVVRNDSRPCPAARNPGLGPCGMVFSQGGLVRNRRADEETLRQIGSNFQLMDLLIYGDVPLPGEHALTVKLGRQTVNWGESTLLVFDAINQANPIDANNLFRVGYQVEEIARPVNMVFASASIAEGLTAEGFYQLEWQPTIAPAPGSFYSFFDVGTHNAGNKTLTLGYGSLPDDPERLGFLIDNPLSGTTNTSMGFERLPDREPGSAGQFGIALKYYAEWLNNGTELSAYFMRYHSRLPYVSVYSVNEACSKNSASTAAFLLACANTPLFHALLTPNDPEGATDSAIGFDEIKAVVEYPTGINMFGLSFNTTLGDVSLQGEVAYRPHAPLQVDVEDLAFAAYGPAGTNCHLASSNCSGSGILPGIGKMADGSTTLTALGSSDFVVDAQGTPGGFRDTFDLAYGHAAGAGRYFPAFIIPWRGQTLGTNAPNSYIRGWEYFDTYQFNLGGTYLMGATEPASAAIGADQIILLFETGATWVPGLPALDELQLEAPGTFLNASAGADGSGADRSRQACSSNEACSYGPDGIRFNPHQEDLALYPDRISAGYDLVSIISYESVLPGISVRPTLMWKHDVHGTAPGLASNFVQGRKYGDVSIEIRYKSQLSFTVGYNLQAGGGKANLWRDRDSARCFIKYQF